MNIQNIPANHTLAYFTIAPGSEIANGIDHAIIKRYGSMYGLSYGAYVGSIEARYSDRIVVSVSTGTYPRKFVLRDESLCATSTTGRDEELLASIDADLRAKFPEVFA